MKDTRDKTPHTGRASYVLAMLFSLAAIAVGCFAAFAVFIKGPEQVMVPDVVGKPLEDALLLMQDKELYAKLTLRHSTAQDKGLVLEQEPVAGSIRKGYSRVALVVSSGPIIDKVANYQGMTLEQVRLSVAAQFAGMTKPLIVIGEPIYKEDDSPAGTILAQEPAANTPISSPVTVRLVVSRGDGHEMVSVPDMEGYTLDACLTAVSSLPLLFDYAAEPADEGAAAHVTEVEGAGDMVDMWSRVKVTLAIPTEVDTNKVYGIFSTQLMYYPKPVQMLLTAVAPVERDGAEAAGMSDEERQEVTIASFMHTGGQVTVPYCVAAGTTLELYAADTLCAEMEVK